ncbi:hypothetical protein ACQP1G_36800 [Nocardia sp. CA-107356]|uniref:hypothetical protein n=1 Tax=Nocardia sp. CA-107356 TaxID=3239972 RepID=UPI003D8D1D7B
MTSSGARHVGNIASIITGTVAEVTREIGEWITDAIEMNEAAAAARKDAAEQRGEELLDDDDFAGTAVQDRADVSYDAEVEPTTSFVEAEVVEPNNDR